MSREAASIPSGGSWRPRPGRRREGGITRRGSSRGWPSGRIGRRPRRRRGKNLPLTAAAAVTVRRREVRKIRRNPQNECPGPGLMIEEKKGDTMKRKCATDIAETEDMMTGLETEDMMTDLREDLTESLGGSIDTRMSRLRKKRKSLLRLGSSGRLTRDTVMLHPDIGRMSKRNLTPLFKGEMTEDTLAEETVERGEDAPEVMKEETAEDVMTVQLRLREKKMRMKAGEEDTIALMMIGTLLMEDTAGMLKSITDGRVPMMKDQKIEEKARTRSLVMTAQTVKVTEGELLSEARSGE